MSWPSFLYVACDRFFIFTLTFIIINESIQKKRAESNAEKTCRKQVYLQKADTLAFCTFFRMPHITWTKKANNFQIAKAQPHGIT